jgi:peptidyl-prolyl cis-trans isomerase SurA
MRRLFSNFPRRFAVKPLLFLLALGAAWALPPAGARAQDQLRITAVVNDDVISQWDLQQRIAFIMVSTGQPRNQENADRLAPVALRQLIDEKLQSKEAKDRGVEVSEAEVNAAISDIEQSNRLPAGQLQQILSQAGLPLTVLSKQLHTRIAWQRNVARRIRATNDVTDEEVDEALAELARSSNKPQNLISEIVLSVDNPEAEAQVRGNAERLVQQIRSGTPFNALARQFSETGAASNEGDLGWVQEGLLDPKIEAALAGMKPGEVSSPIRIVNGYHILQLRDRRSAREIAALGSEAMRMAHASVAMPPGSPPSDITAAVDKLRQATRDARTCEDLEPIGARIGGTSGSLGTLAMRALPAAVQAVVGSLPVNQPSQPTYLEDHVAVLMVCERIGGEVDTGLPSRDQVRERLFLQRVDATSRRYLRDLRLTAYIDVRQ